MAVMSAGSVALVVPAEIGLAFWDLYEVSIPATVFGMPQHDLADPWYDLRMCVTGEQAQGASLGFAVQSRYRLDDIVGADTVIVSSVPEEVVDEGKPVPPELVAALRRAYDAGARMVSLCTGAFALAEAGLLDGRRATAHWMHTARLAERYPKVQVDDSVLYVDDGDVLTSAGMTAGLDLCLHLVRRDLGAHVANQLARRMVVPAHRPGGQAQFIDLSVPATDDQGLAPVLDWARGSGAAGHGESADLLSASPAGRRHDAAPVAAQPASRPGTEPARINRPPGGADREAQRPRHREQPTPSLPQADRDFSERLPKRVLPTATGITLRQVNAERSVESRRTPQRAADHGRRRSLSSSPADD
jgi:transcriptional regulator GlxA family with amidase domain